MDKRTYRLSTPEDAEFIVGVLAPNVLVVAQGRDVTLGEQSVSLLRNLPDDYDGHIDANGVMWVGGTDYPPLATPEQVAPVLKRGARFHAYPGRRVRYGSGLWIERPVYVVTSVRNHGPSKVIYYRCEASPDKRAEAYATVEYLFGNGLEVLPDDTAQEG